MKLPDWLVPSEQSNGRPTATLPTRATSWARHSRTSFALTVKDHCPESSASAYGPQGACAPRPANSEGRCPTDMTHHYAQLQDDPPLLGTLAHSRRPAIWVSPCRPTRPDTSSCRGPSRGGGEDSQPLSCCPGTTLPRRWAEREGQALPARLAPPGTLLPSWGGQCGQRDVLGLRGFQKSQQGPAPWSQGAFSSFGALCTANPRDEAPTGHGNVWIASCPGWEQGGSV